MKRFLAACAAFLWFGCAQADAVPAPAVPAKSWVLYDMSGNQTLGSQDATTRIDPGSLVQLMTVYVALGAVHAGDLSFDKEVQPSKTAVQASRGGPSMYLAPGQAVKIGSLLDGVMVLGAADAATALAEAVGGTEQGFVDRMNAEARRLGLVTTFFKNASGASVNGQYSTAADMLKLSVALLRTYPKDYARYAQKSLTYRGIQQQNRNRLLWTDSSMDGLAGADLRTAGDHLVASAARNERRIVAIVAGASSSRLASQAALLLLNYGFQAFDAVKLYKANEPVRQLAVWKGAAKRVNVGFLTDLVVSVPRDEADAIKLQFSGREPMVAPLTVGEHVGTLRVTLGTMPLGEYPVVVLKDVPLAGWFGRLWDQLRIWLK